MDEKDFQAKLLNLQESYAKDMKEIADGVQAMKKIGERVEEKYDEQHKLVEKLLADQDVTRDELKKLGVRQDELTDSIKATMQRRGSWDPRPDEGQEAAMKGLGEFLYTMLKGDKAKIAEYREKTVKAYAEKGLTTGGTATGAELIPPDYAPQIVRLAEAAAVIRPATTRIPMRATTRTFPSFGAVTGAWEDEEAQSTPQTPATSLITLTAKTVRALVPLSVEFTEDADPDAMTALAPMFARRLSRMMDYQAIDGSGTPFTGVLNSVGVIPTVLPGGAGVGDAIEDVVWTDLSACVGSLTSEALINATWVLHRTVMTALRNIVGSGDGQFVFMPPGQGTPPLMWGYPWILSDDAPATAGSTPDIDHPFMFLGNLANIYFGERRAFEVAISEEFAFDRFQTYMRVAERVAITVALPAAFGVIITSHT